MTESEWDKIWFGYKDNPYWNLGLPKDWLDIVKAVGDRLQEENKEFREVIESTSEDIKKKLIEAWYKQNVESGGIILEYEQKLEAIDKHTENFPTYGLNLIDTYEKLAIKTADWFLELLRLLGVEE